MSNVNDKIATSVQKNMDFLCKKTTNLTVVLVNLFSFRIVSQSERKEIHSYKDIYHRCSKLYEIVLKKLDENESTYKYLTYSLNASGNQSVLQKLIFDISSVVRMNDGPQTCPSVPSFVCDGNWELSNFFIVSQRIELYGFGFLGPTEIDSWYNTKVELSLWHESKWTSCGLYDKRIYAKQRQVFYFLFDKPILIEPGKNSGYYTARINFSLQGPPTQTLPQAMPRSSENSKNSNVPYTTKEHMGVNFQFLSYNRQMVELLFSKI